MTSRSPRAFRPPENLTAQCYPTESLANEIPCTLPEDSSIVIRLSASDQDGFVSDTLNGLDSHTFEIVDEPINGAQIVPDPSLVQDNATVLRYTPHANFHGEDRLTFRVFDGTLYSETTETVDLTILPVPDPVIVEFDDNPRAARGFPSIVKADFSDADEIPEQQSAILSFDWGDGTAATEAGNWIGSGQEDPNGREIRPQVDFGRGSGLLLGSHDYDTTGNYTVSVTLRHDPSDSLPDISYSTNVEVVDVTALGIELTEPAADVSPDVPFPLTIRLENLEPSSWAGLTAGDVEIGFDVPEGVSIALTDTRCSGTDRIQCVLGDMAPGEFTEVTLGGLISLADAREEASYSIVVDMIDNGPKLMTENSASLGFDVADTDGDGVIDALDAFVDDPRWDTDTDGDGLADKWEEALGFDPEVADDVTADTDGDGYTLLDEFINGSFPNRADREFMEPSNFLEIEDYPTEDRFGLTMAGGDLNNDGFTDLVIGASAYEPTEFEGSGAVFIAWGTANGASPALTRLRDPSVQTPFGQAIAIGDWDDNGLPDLAIAAVNDVYIHWNNGEILERSDLTLSQANSTTRIRLQSADLDNDGIEDLLVNSFAPGTTTLNFYLSGNGGIDEPPQTFALTDGNFDGQTVGDIDGDGANDLLLADSAADTVRGYPASANDWTTASGLTSTFSLAPPVGQGRFGWAMAANGDVTGDGIDDLVVGAYSDGGFINLYASESGYIEQPTTAPIQTLAGIPVDSPDNGTHGDQFGVALAVGNLDRDAYADIAVGANRAGGLDEGQIRILRGSPTGFIDEQIENGTTAYDLLGHNVIIPGDVDGDGVADVAGGASDVFTAQNPSPDGGYVQLFYHAFETRDAGDDDDDDGVGIALDNCPADRNTNQSDIDGDGAGDACDDDIDGDGFLNANDNCPAINSTDFTDTDGDFDGDLCDSDDDNDGTLDEDDAFPLNALYNADSDGDGMADAWETDNGLNPEDASDAATDLDGDGRINRDEFTAGTDANSDDVDPVVTAPAEVTVQSIGPWTPVNLGSASANDVLDGDLTPTADRRSPFRPGRHVVTWQATDTAGNAGSDTQTVNVIPQARFVGDTLRTAEGVTVEVLVTLNGDAAEYPVTVPYTVSGSASEGSDYTLSAGDVTIDNTNVGTVSITTLADANAESEESVILTLGTPQNAIAGNPARFDLRIADGNLAPEPVVSIEQNGQIVSTVTRDGAAVILSVDPGDANVGDGHGFAWRASSASIVPQEGFGSTTFTFDPSAVSAGVYRVDVTVTDDGTPIEAADGYRYLRVADSAPSFDPNTDSDGDGLADDVEGLRDSNDNGTSDYLDPVDVSHQVVSRTGGNALLQTLSGYTISLGRVALATGDDAVVSMMDIDDYGNDGSAAGNGMDERFTYPCRPGRLRDQRSAHCRSFRTGRDPADRTAAGRRGVPQVRRSEWLESLRD